MNFFDKLCRICFQDKVTDGKQTDSLIDLFQNLQSNLEMIVLRNEFINGNSCSYNKKLKVTLYTKNLLGENVELS